jgi:hypothetical protein
MLFSNFLLAVADVFHTFSGMCMSVQQEFIRRRIYSPEEFIRQKNLFAKNLFARRIYSPRIYSPDGTGTLEMQLSTGWRLVGVAFDPLRPLG